MGEKTKIEWTWHTLADGTVIKGNTFNLVWGCTKVSEECRFCYAEAWAKRYNVGWGDNAERRIMGVSYWNNPMKWQRKMEKAGTYGFVFCSSMADVFESHPVVDEERKKLWPLIKATPNLVWLLLTKRASNIKRMLPDDWGAGYPNVWLGTTCGTQMRVKEVERLGRIPAVKHFVSVEPLLEDIDFGTSLEGIDWVITGGESGSKAREMQIEWVYNIHRQARAAGSAIFHKQMGEHWTKAEGIHAVDSKGGNMDYWPEELQVREQPEHIMHGVI